MSDAFDEVGEEEESDPLDALPNPIDRGGVLESFKLTQDPGTALDAYIASYLWGYAKTGFGPYRAERVIRLNTDPRTAKTSLLSCTGLPGSR